MKAKKVMALILAAVLLIATSVAATLAYLTDSESVKNTFTVGHVYIDLFEADVNEKGQLLNKDGDVYENGDELAPRVKTNAYHLLPGQTYVKDPKIIVESASEDCYLFVKVENQIAGLEDSSVSIASQMDAKGWQNLSGDIWVYGTTALPVAVSKNANITVFEYFKIKDSATNDDLAAYAEVTTGEGEEAVTTYKSITVTAYAIQKAGFENKTASEIWTVANFS